MSFHDSSCHFKTVHVISRQFVSFQDSSCDFMTFHYIHDKLSFRIGLACAKRLAEDGCKVMISSRREANVNAAVSDLHKSGMKEVKGIVCHVADEGHREFLVQETLKQFGAIDYLICSAGVNTVVGPNQLFRVTLIFYIIFV